MPQATDPTQPGKAKTPAPPAARSRAATGPSRPMPSASPAGSAKQPAPPPTPPDPRSRWIGLAIVGAAAVLAVVVTVGMFVPAIGVVISALSGPTTADPANLPEQILVCDRDYAPSAGREELTLAEVTARDGRTPTIVSAAPDAGCPTGVCVADGMCLTVVYVRTPSDRYIAYELQDGP